MRRFLFIALISLARAASPDGMTPLIEAAHKDDTALAKRLLDSGAAPSAENRYGITPLYLACLNGNGDLVTALLEAGADPNAAIVGKETALMTASRTGKIGAVEALLKAGAKVDARDQSDQSAIMWAAAEGNLEVVKALLAAGADPFRQLENSGYSAFFFAIREGKTELVRLLLEKGADLSEVMNHEKGRGDLARPKTSALMLAVENGHYDLATELLEAGADPNDTRTGFSVLHSLTWIRKPDIGESSDGDPAPEGSGRRNSLQFVRELVKHGADVNLQLKKGRKGGNGRVSQIEATPLFLASDRADLPYIKLLVELGADPLLTNRDGTTPLMVAAGIGSFAPEEEAGNEVECLAAVKYLVSLGADVNTVDKRGETAMHGAAYKNLPSMVHYLDEQGADVEIWNQGNRDKRTPLLIAEGYRPGNFKPSFQTVEAIEKVMKSHGVEIPKGPKPKKTNYGE
ncbi:ankyrin repeat domain-containing protein [Akkermansiaceae bacterium]|nr:ankyrin repeat domain-containing protein [Akkermansiaceae bacterium]